MGEFVVQVRRDAGFESGFFAFVVAFDDLGGFVEAGDDGTVVVGDFEFDEFADRTEANAEFGH